MNKRIKDLQDGTGIDGDEYMAIDKAGYLNAKRLKLNDFVNLIPSGGDIQYSNTIFVDAEYGDNANGQKYYFNKPYQTISAALLAAISGDTIYVRAGSYALTGNNCLGKDGVDFYLEENAVLSLSGGSNTMFFNDDITTVNHSGGDPLIQKIRGNGKLINTATYGKLCRMLADDTIIDVEVDSADLDAGLTDSTSGHLIFKGNTVWARRQGGGRFRYKSTCNIKIGTFYGETSTTSWNFVFEYINILEASPVAKYSSLEVGVFYSNANAYSGSIGLGYCDESFTLDCKVNRLIHKLPSLTKKNYLGCALLMLYTSGTFNFEGNIETDGTRGINFAYSAWANYAMQVNNGILNFKGNLKGIGGVDFDDLYAVNSSAIDMMSTTGVLNFTGRIEWDSLGPAVRCGGNPNYENAGTIHFIDAIIKCTGLRALSDGIAKAEDNLDDTILTLKDSFIYIKGENNLNGVRELDSGTLVAGTGYLDSNYVTTSGGHGTGLIVAILTDGSGHVTAVTDIVNPGTGYHNNDTVTITQPGSGANATIDVLTKDKARSIDALKSAIKPTNIQIYPACYSNGDTTNDITNITAGATPASGTGYVYDPNLTEPF